MKRKISLVDDADLETDAEGLRKALLKELGGRGRIAISTGRIENLKTSGEIAVKGPAEAKATFDKKSIEGLSAVASALYSRMGSLVEAMRKQDEIVREMKRLVADIKVALEGR